MLLRVEKLGMCVAVNVCSAIFIMAYMTQMYSTETHTDTHHGKMTSGTHRRPQRLSQVAMS